MSDDAPRLLLLTRRPDVPTTQRLLRAAGSVGLDAQVLDDRACRLEVSTGSRRLYAHGAPVPTPSAVLPRAAPRLPSFALTVLRALREAGAFVANPPGPLARARNKLRAVHHLAAHGVPVPETVWPCRTDDLAEVVRSLGGPPVVVKALHGTQGMGVCRADSLASARSVVEAFFAARVPVVLQRYVAEADGVDHRVLVVGGQVVAAMERRAPAGDFRANVHRGAVCSALDLSPAEAATALAAARVMRLDVAGVDLLPSSRGPLVLEVNASPGLTGIESATGVDVSRAICSWIAARVGAGAGTGAAAP